MGFFAKYVVTVVQFRLVAKCFFTIYCFADFQAVPGFVLTPPPSITVTENDDVILRCRAIGYPVPEITWFKGLTEVNQNLYTSDSGTLTIQDIKFADHGSYRCEAQSFVGKAKFTTTITVEGNRN